MVSVHLEKVSKLFGTVRAVDNVSLDIKEGELFFLLGPSGCGKTTCLRIVAGFYEPDEGQLRFGTRMMNRVPPHLRNTGMVFQNYALWPHMTVFENVEYGLTLRKFSAAERRKKVMEALEIVRMTEHAHKSPNQLSGGQQQRVALARALVIEPEVLLLDEPLSNLDAKLRLEMRQEIKRIHKETHLTAIYVTHDQKEALSIADRMAVMNAGRVEQVGTPREVYRRPANRFVAEFIGETNFIPGKIGRISPMVARVETPVGPLLALRPAQTFHEGASVLCCIRPEALSFVAEHATVDNHVDAVIESVIYLGDQEQYQLHLDKAGDAEWSRVKVTVLNPGEPQRAPGQRVTLFLNPEDIAVLPATG
ncbi:MAG: ABC transporter ATP-binding protein [Abditibacteriales bacterium]|nr:ABC transporter ATP-binding protein [Abditibacteriales bacterium]MDW8365074.1 ABC transporter ATP-binding protein [Abditibacteriales bacterium]